MQDSEGQMMKSPAALFVVAIALAPATAGAQERSAGDPFWAIQKQFEEAYNRKDVEAMAMAFSDQAIRVTPSGVFKGRDEIRSSLQEALNLGLRDYAVRRTVSRAYGDFVFNVGEWQAKLGDQPFHGYYTAILGREGDQVRILEETVTVAASGR
jgi:ketosteroid isomerase-like protein